MRSLWLDITFAWRNVARHRRRTAIALCAIGFGVIAYLLAAGFIQWIFWAMREDTIHSHLGHVQVVRTGYLEAGLAEPFAYLLPEGSAERRAIEALPAVKLVAPRLSFSGLINHGESTISFVADGVSPEAEALLSRTLLINEGQALSSSDPKGVILGRGLAANLGVKTGDTVVLLVNTRSGGINAVEGRVRGLFSTITKAYDDSALRLPLAMAQSLLRTEGAHRWVVLLEDTAQTGSALQRLQRQLAGLPYEVVPWFKLADFYNKTVALFSKQVGVMKGIIALIIILSISNTMLMSVMERTGEIGTLMALGSARGSIVRLFVSEGAVLGLIGGVLGLLVGLILAHAISAVGIPMPPYPGMARGFTGEIRVSWPLAADALVLALGTTLLASIYPAWRASRMVIVDALRHNR